MATQPRPVPIGPAAHVLKDLLAVDQHPALRLQVVGVGFAGPRFWHGRVMLRWAEFWLWSNSSPYDRVGQRAIPGYGAVVHIAN